MSDDAGQLRADARENRNRILEVAREAFTRRPEASLNSIAKAAGVGAGTLYRHFPSREALLAGVYRKEIEELAALAPALVLQHPPMKALGLWFERFTEASGIKHGVGETLHAAVSEQDMRDTFGILKEAVGRLLFACEQAGKIGPGIPPEDVLVLLSSVLRIAPTAEGRQQARRIQELIVRGITAGQATVQR